MQKNTATYLGIASAIFGVLLFLVSVTGLFFGAATKVTDPGMLSTVLIFVLFGVVGWFIGQRPAKA